LPMAEHQAVEIAAWALGQLAIGEGGWVAFADDSVPEWVHVRVRENGHGRLVICELYLAREQRVDSAALRALPLGRIEAQVNAFAGEIRPHLKDMPRPGVELQPPSPNRAGSPMRSSTSSQRWRSRPGGSRTASTGGSRRCTPSWHC
jgi:hypothetical protein